MQKEYINELFKLMKNDSRVFSLLSDSGTTYDMLLSREFPERCLNFGIAEQNKIAAASGMAALGKIPFVFSQSPFLAYRAYEFIRDDVCFQNRNVKIVGIGSGLSISQLGPSHHTTEDISVLSSLPNLTIFSPGTPIELCKCVQAAYEIEGPVYIRMGMGGEPELKTDIYDSETDDCSIHKAILVCDDDDPDTLVISTGSIVTEVVNSANRLQQEKYIRVRVLHIPTIKPLDRDSILKYAHGVKSILSVEEHNVIGGIGGLVASVLSSSDHNFAPMTYIGLNDCFASGYGTHKQVLSANELDSSSIYQAILKSLNKE